MSIIKKADSLDYLQKAIEQEETFHDIDEALFWYKKSLSTEVPASYYRYGLCLLSLDDLDGLKKLDIAHKEGFLDATKTLASYYANHHQHTLSAHYYYTLYQEDALHYSKALFENYTDSTFKTAKEEHAFLKKCVDNGLFRARFRLALFYLSHPSFERATLGEMMLEDYFKKSDDVTAAVELFYLYSDQYPKYKNFTGKDNQKAAHYFAEVMRLDGTLEGADIFDLHPFYMNEDLMSVHDFIEQIIFRLKTSLSVDLDFEARFEKSQLNLRIHCAFEPIIEVEGHVRYEQDEITSSTLGDTYKVPVEKAIELEEGAKSELIESTMTQINALKDVITTLETKDNPIDFEPLKTESEIKAFIDRMCDKVSLPTDARHIQYDYTYHYLYVIHPSVSIDYTYKGVRYQSTHDLSDMHTINNFKYPLASTVVKEMRHDLHRIKSAKHNTLALFIFTSIIQSFILIGLYDLLAFPFRGIVLFLFILIPLTFNLWLFAKAHFFIPTQETYLSYYDKAERESLLKKARLNHFNALTAMVYALLMGFMLFLIL